MEEQRSQLQIRKYSILYNTLHPALAVVLDQMTSKGLFQPQISSNFMILASKQCTRPSEIDAGTLLKEKIH